MTVPRELSAYRRPQQTRPGCTHQLGCRCDPPFWLRLPSPAEEEMAERIYGPRKVAPQEPE